MKKTYSGEFEEVVLITIIMALLYKQAYGKAITKSLEQLINSSLSIWTMHATLNLFQDKGFVCSYLEGDGRGFSRSRLRTVCLCM